MQETRVRSLGREDPLKEERQPTPVLLPGKPHGQRSRAGYSPWGRKESDTTQQLNNFRPRGWEELRDVPKCPKQMCLVGGLFHQSRGLGHLLLAEGIFGPWPLTSLAGESGSGE